MQQQERNGIIAHLYDGRQFNLCTESGANAFLQVGSQSNECLCGHVETMSEICAKRRLNAKDKRELLNLNLLFGALSQFGSRDAFRQHVQEKTVKAWLDHLIKQIKRFSTNRNWITTGKLATYDVTLLESSVVMMGHVVPVALAFESEFFNVLADFVKARKGNGRALPSAEICNAINLVVSNSYNVSRTTFDNTWTTEKALKKLEATGILAQFLRCVTVPQPIEADGLFGMLDEFQACVPFISNKLQRGQPLGDVVFAILAGKDGSRVPRPIIMNKLTTMSGFASSKHYVGGGYQTYCKNCSKTDLSKSFQMCSRCQYAHYCSKECQRAHWKTHKKTCFPRTKKENAISEKINESVTAFWNKHYVRIMVKMVEACDKSGLLMNEMLIELNFMANERGIVPAMQDTPEFKIAPVKDYIEGSRPAEPDWFGKNQSKKIYEANIKSYLDAIKEHYSEVKSNQVLCLIRYKDGVTSYVVDRNEEFSHKAVLAFKTYMNDGNDGPLSTLFEPLLLKRYKYELYSFYGYGKREEQAQVYVLDPKDIESMIRMYKERFG